MRKIKKSTSYSHRVFAAVLAATLLFTMPGTASVAMAENVGTEDISESVTVQAEDDTGNTETDAQEPAEEEADPTQKEDIEECICEALCTEDSINEDCPVCGAEDAGEQDGSANLCAHHKEHTGDCGYSRASEDGEGSLCTYECRICPIDALIAALPRALTEDNAETVRWQLDEILDLWRELTEDEQEQIDLTRCWDLQAVLDETNAPVTVDEPTEGDVAMVKKEGEEPAYVTNLADAFGVGNDGATVTLLGDVELSTMMQINSGSFTLNLNGHMISNPTDMAISLNNENVNLTICGTGNVRSGASSAVCLLAGTLTLEGGTFSSSGETSCSVTAYSGTLKIAGSEVTVDRLGVSSGAQATLSAGTYTGNSAIMASGKIATLGGLLGDNCAYYRNGRPIALADLPEFDEEEWAAILPGPVTVAECTHPEVLKDQGDGTHGGDCTYCGAEFAEKPHTLGPDNKCEDCKAELKVKVETSDGTAIYLGESDFAKAFDTYYNYNNVTVTLLSDIQPDNIDMGGVQARVHVLNISTLDLAGHTITSSDTAIYVWPTGTLTIKDSSSGKTGQVVSIDGVAILTQTSMVSLMGGTYTGGPTIDGKSSSTDVSSLLANYGTQTTPHYAYFDAQGNPVALEENQRELTGTVTVKECDHKGIKASPNNDGTHTLKCPYCGYTETAENCSYGTEYQHDDTYHWLTCTVCGYENKEAHNWEFVYDQTGNVTENFWECFDCGRTKAHLTLTITVPDGLTYGNTEGKQVTYTVSPETTCDKVRWRFTGGSWPEFADGVLPANLPVGEHWFRVEGLMEDDTIVFSGSYYFTVAPAPLTGDMVTLSTESVTYSGAEQKPVITVKQGETPLEEGTDYDVTYSTTDFTNAGTVTVTITGKGNYTGTAETTYTIEKAPLTITANDQTITYGGSITQSTDNVTAAGLCGGHSLGGVTLTASTANVPGGNITPSAAGIKNSGGKDATGNYEITYKDGKLTINKADAEITVGTGTYNKTYGDAAFTLDVTDNNTEADVQYEVIAGADVVSVSNGTVTIKNAGTAAITVSLPASTNYNAAASRTVSQCGTEGRIYGN